MKGLLPDNLKSIVSWRALIVVLHSFITIMLMQQPGFKGLGYMSCLAQGFLLLISGPLYGLSLPVGGSLRELTKNVAMGAGFLVLPALLFGLLQSLWFPLCDPARALLFVFLGPFFGAIFGIVLGASIAESIRGRSRWWGVVAWFTLLCMSAFFHVWRIYTEPSVFFYHPIVGYFAGPIYDTTAEVSSAYWLHRLWWLGGLPLFLAPWFQERKRWRLIGLVWLLTLFSMKSLLGFDPGRHEIMKHLSVEKSGTYVRVSADPNGYTKQDLEQLVRVMDFHVVDLCSWLGRALPTTAVHALVFKDSEQKRRLMGAGRTEVAKPWLNEIYVAGIKPGDSVIRHELAHVLAGDLASGPMEVPASFVFFPNMVLVEGLATAATWESGALTPHGWSAMMDDLDIRPPISQLLGPVGFWKAHGALAYTLSASFIEWYRQEFGTKMLQEAYASGQLVAPTGEGLGVLETRWLAECLKPEASELGNEARDIARERFARRPTYQRPCGFVLKKRIQALLLRARSGDLDHALNEVKELLLITGGDPNISVLSVRAARLAIAPETMIHEAQALLADETIQNRPELIAFLHREVADACWWLGIPECSRTHLGPIATDLLSRSLARSIWVRRLLLAEPSGDYAIFLDYLSGFPGTNDGLDNFERVAKTHPVDPIVNYLVGFHRANHGQWPEAKDSLASVGRPILWPSVLIREASFRGGRLAAYLDHAEDAEVLLKQAIQFEPLEGHRVPIQRWLRYVRYYRNLKN